MIASIPSEKHYLPPPEPPDDGTRRVAFVMFLTLALALIGAALTH